ncbi:murein biosynthesis integral membrane protein MurJ [Paenibacillus chungangensis]|uniref:Probable lipid II flippase MurJ n=1 Tax=Paenibacillus chungangensis TaxID=696535 RepID=A0ABW3HVX8_9BACL
MKKIIFSVTLIAIISKLFGFGREISLSYIYGATSISDAYLISVNIPNLVFGILSAGIISSYIPMYTEIELTNGRESANRFTSNLINVMFVVCTILVTTSILYTEEIVSLLAPGFNQQTLVQATVLTKVTIFAIYVNGIVAIMSGFLQVNDRHNITVLNGLILNVVIILTIVISPMLDFKVLAYGFLLGILSKILIMIPSIRREGYNHQVYLKPFNPELKKMLFTAIPVIIGTSVNQLNMLVDKNIASRLGEGGISALNYASRLNELVQGVLILPVVLVLFPMLSKLTIGGEIVGFKKIVSKTIIGISALVVPISFGSMLFSEELTSLLFDRGAFDQRAVIMTSSALFFYSIGMIGFGFRELLARAFYSLQDTKTPMINAVIGVVVNIILNIVLSKFLGLGGLALATSISAIFTSVLLFGSLKKKIGSIGMNGVSISVLKIFISAIIMGLGAKACFLYLSSMVNEGFSVLLSILVGGIIYFTALSLFKIDEIELFIKDIRRKLEIPK